MKILLMYVLVMKNAANNTIYNKHSMGSHLKELIQGFIMKHFISINTFITFFN